MNQKRLIITGCPRSGTSALSMLISNASNGFVCNELGAYYSNRKEFNNKMRQIDKMMKEDRIRQPFGVQGKAMKLTNLSAQDIIEYVKNDSYGDLDVFGDKHPHYCITKNNLRHLRNKYSHFYYLICYRDPLDTIASFIRKSRAKDPQPGYWFCKTIPQAIMKWKLTIRNWTQELYKHVEKKKIIKYEDYCDQGDKLINDLSSFLGVKLETTNIDALGTFREVGDKLYYPVHVGGYKEVFGPKQITTIKRRTQKLHERVMKLIDRETG